MKIPATIITGFLGAGKTTVIRHLLENANGKRSTGKENKEESCLELGLFLKGCEACWPPLLTFSPLQPSLIIRFCTNTKKILQSKQASISDIGKNTLIFARFGMWRSLVAHLTGGQGVAGSNPVIPTNYKNTCGSIKWSTFSVLRTTE